MAPRRQQIETQSQNPVLRPVTSPVDTFVRPAGNKTQLLAEALSSVAPSVGRFSEVLAKRTAEEQREAGERAARDLNAQGLSMAEATRTGKLPASENPWFVAGLREQFGRVTADNWKGDFKQAMALNESLKNSTDVRDFDKFVAEHRETWLKERVGDDREANFERGFGSRWDAYRAELRNIFADRIEGKLKSQADDAHFAEVKEHITQNIYRSEVTAADIALGIEVLHLDAVNQGRKPMDVARAAAKAIAASALETDDYGHKALDLLKQVRVDGRLLKDYEFGSKLLLETEAEIAEQSIRKAEREHRLAERLREQKTRAVLGDAIKLLQEDPSANLKSLLPQLSDAPDAANALVQLQRSVTTLSNVTDEDVKRDLYSRIWSAPENTERTSEVQILENLSNRNLTTEDAAWLMNQLDSFRSTIADRSSSIWSDPDYKREMGNLGGRIGNPMVRDEDAGDRVAYSEAMFASAWAQLNSSGEAAKMGDQERRRWLSDTAGRIIEQQRGTNRFPLAPAPAPQFEGSAELEAKMPKTLVFNEAELAYGLNGQVSDEQYARLRALNIRSPSELGAFYKTQARLFAEQYGREPVQPKKSKKKEE